MEINSMLEIPIPAEVRKIIEDQIEAYPMFEDDRMKNRGLYKAFAEMGYRLALHRLGVSEGVSSETFKKIEK